MKTWFLGLNISVLGLAFTSVTVAQMNKPANLGTLKTPAIQIEKVNSGTKVDLKTLQLDKYKLSKEGFKISPEGGIHGGGGNGDIAEFYTFVRAMAVAYRDVYSKTSLGSKSSYIQSLYKKLKVEETTEDLYLRGQLVEAINYPSEVRIVFNSKKWATKSPEEKLQLVAHELLGLLNVEDPKYEVSGSIILEMRSEGYDKDILKMSQPLQLRHVKCHVWRNYDYSSVFKTFQLTPTAGGLGERVYLTNKVFVEVYFGYGPKVQNRVELYSAPNQQDSPETMGHIIASTTMNFIGDAADAELKTSEWEIICKAN